MRKLPTVHIWTDGGGKNQGAIGACAVLHYNGAVRVVASRVGVGSNNAAETAAVLVGLRALTRACNVVIHTDSQYVYYGIRRINNGSLLETNPDWWERVRKEIKSRGHRVSAVLVEGHGKDRFGNDVANNLADAWAGAAARGDLVKDEKYASLEDAVQDAPARVQKKNQKVEISYAGRR